MERYKAVDGKIANFNTFPKVIRKVLSEHQDVFDTKLQKSMNLPPAVLNKVK